MHHQTVVAGESSLRDSLEKAGDLARAVDPLAGPGGIGGIGELAVLRSSPDDALLFFPRTANGNVAPLRAIVGAATQFNGTSFLSYFPSLIFADGYASGTSSAWSATVP